jgi:hypothetical protein
MRIAARPLTPRASEDTVELFNLILGTKLTKAEKSDLVAFLRCL